MADVAKIFMNGGSQAVRLPKQYRFEEQSEVLIYREGQRVVLEPRRKAWSRQFRSLAGVSGDLPYPEAPPPVEAGPDLDPGS